MTEIEKITSELFDNLETKKISTRSDSVMYIKNKDFFMEHDKKTNILWCSYVNIWSVMERFGFEYHEISDMIKKRIEKYPHLKNAIPSCKYYRNKLYGKS